METASDRQKGSVVAKSVRKNIWPRILTAATLVLVVLYHVVVQYYSSLKPPLLALSENGLKALAAYECGNYESASLNLRRHYGLTYANPSRNDLRKDLDDEIQKNPGNMEPYYLLADLFFFQRKYDDTARIYKSALALKRDDYQASVGLATSMALKGEYKKANALFARLFQQSYQGSVSGLLQILFLLGRLESDIGNSSDADLYLVLANTNRYLRVLDERREKTVILYADKALALDGTLSGAYFSKGVMFMKSGAYDQALAEFARITEINPGDADAYNRMGFIYGMMGNLEKELASYRKAVDLEGENPLFALRLANILRDKYGDYQEAAFYFKKASDLKPDDLYSMFWHGYSLAVLEEYDKALEVSTRIMEQFPTLPHGYKLRGGCFLVMQQYEEAVKWYMKSQEVAVRWNGISMLGFSFYSDWGLAYRKLKRPADAITAYRQALALKPYDVNTLFTLQYLYRGQGRYHDAYEAVKNILRIQPDHSGARSLVPYLERNVSGQGGG